MNQFILTGNVRHLRQRLKEAVDDAARQRVQTLLLTAERELALYSAGQQGLRQPWDRIPPGELDAARAARIEWFLSTYAQSPKLAALIDPAPGLEIVEINQTYAVATDMVREQIVGKLLFELFPDNPDDPTATGVRNLYDSLRAVATTGNPHVLESQRYDTRDAAGAWQERYWRPVNSPLYDDQDRLVFLLHVVEEVNAPY